MGGNEWGGNRKSPDRWGKIKLGIQYKKEKGGLSRGGGGGGMVGDSVAD